MQLTPTEWFALLLDSGRRHILDDLRRNGFRAAAIPPEVVAVVDAHLKVAGSDRLMRRALSQPVAPADNEDRMRVGDAADRLDVDRATVYRRAKARGVPVAEGRIRTDDLEKLK